MKHSVAVRIYYEDTDAGGVVYYANYLRYMERARMELLAACGIDAARYHKEGLFFVVAHADINYKSPARLGDLLYVTAETTEMKQASVKMSHKVTREGALIAEAEVALVMVGRDGRPRRIPEEIRKPLQRASAPPSAPPL